MPELRVPGVQMTLATAGVADSAALHPEQKPFPILR
jgi:hypothetical protein